MPDREQPVAQRIAQEAERLVVALPLLVLDHAALLVELVLADRAEQVAHAVAFHEQREIERTRRHGLDIIGAIVPGRAVGGARTHRFQRHVEARHVLRSAEEQVLVKMREAGCSTRFVLRADPVIDRHADDRRLAVGVNQHAQAVGKRELFERDVDLPDQLAQRRGGGLGSLGGGGDKREREERGGVDRAVHGVRN